MTTRWTARMAFARPAAWGSALVAGLILAACGANGANNEATATVSKGDLVQTVRVSGATVAATQAKLGFKIPGKIASIKVGTGDQVAAGQVLAELDPSDAQSALNQAQAADDVARAAVAAAQARVQQLQQSAKPENIAQANAALDAAKQKLSLVESGARQEQIQQAQAAVQAAQAKLQALQNGPRPEQVAVLQKQVDAAKNALYSAQTARDGQCNHFYPDYLCSAAQAQVNAAQTSVDTAVKQLQLATAPPTATDLQQAQAAVDQAKAQLAMLQSNTPQDIQSARDAVTQAQAQAQLAARPYTDADMAAAQAGVQQAQAQLAQADAAVAAAKNNLGFTELKAPVAGKVLQVNNAAGEVISPANAVIVVASGDLVVNAGLPESALSQVKAGQDAEVRFESLAGKVYTGKVVDLPAAGTATQNLVSYVATVKLDNPDDSIRPGMNASVTIYTVRKKDVLLVPNLALQSYQGKEIVLVPGSDGQTKQVAVQLGAADSQHTEVLGGLSEGQRVLLIGKPLNGISIEEGK